MTETITTPNNPPMTEAEFKRRFDRTCLTSLILFGLVCALFAKGCNACVNAYQRHRQASSLNLGNKCVQADMAARRSVESR